LAKTKDISGFEESQKASSPKGKNYLLAIAIDAYDGEPKGIPRLFNCVKDAKDLIEVLKQRFGFQKAQVMTIFDEEATLGNINRKLDKLTNQVTSEDNVIVYFSGHGYYRETQKEGYLIPVDGKSKDYWSYLSNANLLTHIRAIKSFHTFLIIDSCFSGSLFATKSTDYAYSDRAATFPSRWGLAAGRIEKVSDGFHGENSPFAKSIITFLKNTNQQKNPVSELVQYVKKTTARNSDQTPIGGSLFKVGDMDGEFVFHLKNDFEDESEKRAFEDALASTDEEKLIYFIETSTNKSYKKQVSKRLQKLEIEIEARERWEVLNKKSYAALSDFLLDYPQTIYKKEAKELLRKIKEDKVWKKLLSSKKQSAFQGYLDEYPRGQYAQIAKEKIKSLELKREEEEKEQSIWDDARRRDVASAYEGYLQLYPSGKYVRRAKEAVEKIKSLELKREEEKEQSIWDDVRSRDVASAYERYLRLYPSGKYVSKAKEAEAKINNLRKDKEKRKKTDARSKIIVPKFSSFTDPRDSQEYKTVELKDGKMWMAENLNFDVPIKDDRNWFAKQINFGVYDGSWFCDDDKKNGKKYGRLYTWDAALKACPDGWHLPSDEEWKNLAAAYGGYHDWESSKDNGDPKLSYKALMSGGNSGFSALLGGSRYTDGSYYSLGRYGLYWSSSEKSSDNAWNYYFYEPISKLYRFNSYKEVGLSCRCVKDSFDYLSI